MAASEDSSVVFVPDAVVPEVVLDVVLVLPEVVVDVVVVLPDAVVEALSSWPVPPNKALVAL